MAVNRQTSLHFEADKVIQPIFTGGDVSIDSTGRTIAACVGEDALITELRSGEALCRIEGDGEILTALQITPDGSHVVLCSRSLSMRIFSLQAQDSSHLLAAVLLKTHKPHNTPVVIATIDHTSTLLATGSADGAVKVWDIRGGYATHTFRGHSGIVSALKFFELSPLHGNESSTGKGSEDAHRHELDRSEFSRESRSVTNASFRLASGGDDGQIRIWDLEKKKSTAVLTSHVSVIRGLDFDRFQNALVSSSRDKTLIVWDARTWKTRKVIPAFEVLEDVAFVNGGRYVCTGGEQGDIRVWHTDSGREITQNHKSGSDTEAIVKLLLPSESSELYSVNAEQVLTIQNLECLDRVDGCFHIKSLPVIRRISGTHDEVIDLAYVSSQRNLLALATNTESVRLVSIDRRQSSDGQGLSFGSDIGLLEGHTEIVICLDTDWSGCWLVTGSKDNTARLWCIDHESQSFVCYSSFTGHAGSLGAVALPKTIPQEDSAALRDPLLHPPSFLITGSQDKTIKRWSIATGNGTGRGNHQAPKAVYTRRAHDKDINALSVNSSGALFASASQDRTVKIWSTEEGEVQGILKGHKRGIWSVAFAPRGTPAILGDDSSRSSGSRGVILTGSGDKTVKIWSLSDYSCLRTFEGHTNSVLKVIWLPARSRASEELQEESEKAAPQDHQKTAIAVSAGSDGLVRLWDAQSGESATVLDNHTDRIWALAAHPENGDLISGGADSVITVWKDVSASAAAARADAATQRVEQEQDLSNHIHRGNYREAIILALTLNHPARLLALFANVVKKNSEEGSLSGLKAVDEVLSSLSDDQLFTLLLRLRDWNTNARTAPVAQRILHTVFKSYPRERIVALAQGKGRRGFADVLEALKTYTDRHYRRMEELMEESYVVDFMVRGMAEGAFMNDETNQDAVMVG